MPSELYTETEKEFLGQVSGFAARHAINSMFITTIYSKSLNAPVVMVIALGEQASMLQGLINKHRVPVQPPVEIVKDLNNPKW